MKKIFILFSLLGVNLLFAQVKITNTSIYKTAEQMLLANEINESGEPFAEALGYNLDDLDPFVANSPDSISYTLGIDNYEYSRYQLGTIISRSGMGLHMIWAPVIGKMASMETDPNFDGSMTGNPNGYNEDDELKKNIMHFSMLANHPPPGNPFPQFAEFVSGDPKLPQAVDANKFAWEDFSTLRWDRSKMDKTLNLAAMGQSMMKQYLWAQDMLSAFHDADDNGIDADGVISPDSAGSIHFDASNNVFYGGNNLDGFIGQILTAESINKTNFLINKLAYNGTEFEAIDPSTYDPALGIKYFPHKIAVTETMVDATMPPKPTNFEVTDASSQAWDQVSFLWATISFKNMMDPNNSSDSPHLAYKSVFDGDPFPAAMEQTGMPGPFDLMKGTSKVLALNLMAMHFNSEMNTFVDEANVVSGSVEMGNKISTFTAGYLLSVLKIVVDEMPAPLSGMISSAVESQANFMIDKLLSSNGMFYNSYIIGTGADNSATTVESQSAAIKGLLSAYQLTQNTKYLNAANLGYDYLISNFYVAKAKAFRTIDGVDLARYTPLKFAAIAGALRESALVANKQDAPIIYTRFFTTVANVMQLSEGGATGESGGDSDGDGIPFIPEQADNLPPVFASEATFDLSKITSVNNDNSFITTYNLHQNYPNPFNPTTTISFDLPTNNFVTLKIYNLLGREVATLVNSNQNAGNHKIQFNASNLASGVYLYKIKAGNFTSVKKLTLIK